MLNPISVAFKKARTENRPVLLTYTVAGDSSKKQSLDILKSISKNADILEVGVPHNTPVADGSQIQTSAYRAIKKGIKINDIYENLQSNKEKDQIELLIDDFKKINDDLKQNNIVIDKGSADLLKGSEIDFVEELIGSSFKINNPQSKSSCGCGVSFSL